MATSPPESKRLPMPGVPDDVGRDLYACGSVAFYPDKTPILNLGQEQDHLFFLESGTIEVENIHGGRIYDVGQMSAGSFFGEIGFFTDHTSTVSLLAATGCSVWSISKIEFNAFLDAHAKDARSILYFFLSMIANRLRQVYEREDEKGAGK